MEATVEAKAPSLIEMLTGALEELMLVQQYATGWDNGVSEYGCNEGDHWHGLAMDRAAAALAAATKATP